MSRRRSPRTPRSGWPARDGRRAWLAQPAAVARRPRRPAALGDAEAGRAAAQGAAWLPLPVRFPDRGGRHLLQRDRYGDLCAGDPACDLASWWILLPGDAVGRLHAAYRPTPDAATLCRPRGWAALRALDGILIGNAGVR
jgi:hypothetical protein